MPGASPIDPADGEPRLSSSGATPTPREFSFRGALCITLTYTILIAAWIALGDRVLERLFPDPGRFAIAQTIKDWGFVAVSGAMAFLLVLRELHSQRQADRTRREGNVRSRSAADQVEALIRSSPLAIIILGADGRARLWNPGAERIFGWSAEEVIGREVPFVPNDKRSEYQRNVERVLAGESLADVEAVRRRKDGTLVVLRLWTAPLRDEHWRLWATRRLSCSRPTSGSKPWTASFSGWVRRWASAEPTCLSCTKARAANP